MGIGNLLASKVPSLQIGAEIMSNNVTCQLAQDRVNSLS
jgi:hypothetical protein